MQDLHDGDVKNTNMKAKKMKINSTQSQNYWYNIEKQIEEQAFRSINSLDLKGRSAVVGGLVPCS